jgi:hypothetical protein
MGLAVRIITCGAIHPPLDAESRPSPLMTGSNIDDNKIRAHKEKPLTLLLMADCWTAHLYEEGRSLYRPKGGIEL